MRVYNLCVLTTLKAKHLITGALVLGTLGTACVALAVPTYVDTNDNFVLDYEVYDCIDCQPGTIVARLYTKNSRGTVYHGGSSNDTFTIGNPYSACSGYITQTSLDPSGTLKLHYTGTVPQVNKPCLKTGKVEQFDVVITKR